MVISVLVGVRDRVSDRLAVTLEEATDKFRFRTGDKISEQMFDCK